MNGAATRRCLGYAGVDPAWEQAELRAFSHGGAIRTATAVNHFLLGRLLQEDLHVSCRPMLPPNVDKIQGSVLRGVCLLQIVDIANIGANYEHRTEDAKGPTRTLKLALTDGHQIVSGFEYKWLPSLATTTPRGTKVLVQNVAIRHGLLLLTPETCQVLGTSGNATLEVGKAMATMTNPIATPEGAYSAALVTKNATINSGLNLGTDRPNKPPSHPPRSKPVPMLAPPAAQSNPSISISMSSSGASTQRQSSTSVIDLVTPKPTSTLPPQAPMRTSATFVSPPVFVDVSSEDDGCASDTTDPMVEHLFYSPNTPRIPATLAIAGSKNSRKRPRPEPQPVKIDKRPTPSRQSDIVDVTMSPPTAAPEPPLALPTFSLLGPATGIVGAPPIVDLTTPFQYFSARLPCLTAPKSSSSVITIRGFVKSVAGFQFNTGVYVLRVLIEDCTETREVQVDPRMVEKLMGVSCFEFMTAMQKTPTVAHDWAAKMQVKLMTMQGIMQLRPEGPNRLILVDCRDYELSETYALLSRITSRQR